MDIFTFIKMISATTCPDNYYDNQKYNKNKNDNGNSLKNLKIIKFFSILFATLHGLNHKSNLTRSKISWRSKLSNHRIKNVAYEIFGIP
jgi:hypothetical protein